MIGGTWVLPTCAAVRSFSESWVKKEISLKLQAAMQQDIIYLQRLKKMKKFTIEVSHASTGQLQTIALELKIMANEWKRHGPRITINGKPVPKPQLREAPSAKHQASSFKPKGSRIWPWFGHICDIKISGTVYFVYGPAERKNENDWNWYKS